MKLTYDEFEKYMLKLQRRPDSDWIDLLSAALELPDDEKDVLEYFCWELDFGQIWEPGYCHDYVGREIKLGSIFDLWKYLRRCDYDTVYEKTYETSNGNLIAEGTYKGFKYYIKNNVVPCCYVDMSGTYYEKDSPEEKYNWVHGGFTYNEDQLIIDGGVVMGRFWGWDYGHYGDYLGVPSSGKKWTELELLKDVKGFIDEFLLRAE